MGWNQQERGQPDDICHGDWFVHCHSKEQRWQANRGNSRIGSCSRRSAAAWGMNVLLDANVFYDVSNISLTYLEMRHSIHLTRGKTRHLNSFGGFRVLDRWTETVAFCSGPSIQEKASIQWPMYWSWSLKLSRWTDTHIYIYIILIWYMYFNTLYIYIYMY